MRKLRQTSKTRIGGKMVLVYCRHVAYACAILWDLQEKYTKKRELTLRRLYCARRLKASAPRVGLRVVPFSLTCYNLRLSQSPMLKGKAHNSLQCRCTSTQSKYTNRALIAVCVQLSSSFGADQREKEKSIHPANHLLSN